MKFSKVTSFVLLIASFSSCQKVIQLDLKTSAPQYVIEGSVNDQPGPYTVKISQSKSFTGNNNFPKVSNAVVTITDNNSDRSDTLKESSPGIYSTSHIVGMPGHTYHLYVNIEGKVFTASSTMPARVNIDSVYAVSMPFPQGVQTCAVPVFTDPTNKGNYYHFVQYVNDTISKDIFVLNDDYLNGTKIETPLFGQQKIHTGDRLSVCLQNIDAAMYNYYFSLSINKDVATPANPVNNISGGSLGYFSACSVSISKTIIAP